MPPRLAREAVTAAALRGDTVALLSACAYLPPREAFRYDRRRAAAFSSALAGDRQVALNELGLGGGVRSVRLGLDTAVIELLTRGAGPAVEAVRLALRDGVHGEPDVPLLLAACVRRDPELTRSALAVALSGGTALERTRAAAAVIGAARPAPVQAAVPVVVAVSLAVAVLAFLRLPGLTDPQEAATPRLQEPGPSVVVGSPPEAAGEGAPLTGTPGSSTPGAAQIAVRFTPDGPGSADGTGSLHGRAAPRPATPRPTPNAPAPEPSAPAPTEPGQPLPPAASSPPLATQSSPAAAPASIAPPAAAPPAEEPRQPAVVKRSKAERKAEKAERKAEKAEQKAARKADSAQPTALAAAAAPTPEAEAAAAPAPASVPDDASTRQAKPDKPEKPDKPDKGK